MGYAMFIIGGLLLMSALIVYWLGYRLCCKIANATASDPDGLNRIETWERNHHNKMWKKLKKYRQSEDEELKAMATKAMRLDVARIVLCFAGMIIMAIGAILF